MYKFGQRLKKLRQELGVSQSYLAENIGVSVQSVSNWECDTTMPDISQIVPLVAILGVSTDFLLGNDCNEAMDVNELKLEIDKVWATYSVNTFDNNADYMVYELYSDFLKKYPLNYEIKYKCALAIHDYLFVAKVRQKFNINEKEYIKLYAECEKLLWSIIKYDSNLQRQIEARELLIRHYTLNEQWDEALNISDSLPNIYGIKQDNICAIELYRWGKERNANSLAMEDIRFFVIHTPIWCHDKAPKDLANSITNCQQYAECKKRIDDIVYDIM